MSALRVETTVVAKTVKRKVYPYSVVPGGASNLREAKQAMSDPAVKEHYSGVDFKQLKQVTLDHDLVGYVSYRMGDKIYWTTKKLRIRAGEKVFTDGVHVVRGRCLNCYSEYPMLPVRPHEPTEKLLDTPVEIPLIAFTFPVIPVPEAPKLPPPLEELTPTVPLLSPGPTATPPGRTSRHPFIPIIPIIPPIHRHHQPPPILPVVPIVPITVVTPEPRLQWMIAGLMVVAGWFLRRRQQC